MCPPLMKPPSHFLPHPIPLGCPRALALCALLYALNLYWLSILHMVIYPIPKKGNAKECSNYCTIALIIHASKVMLKILQARLQQYVSCELPDVQGGFRKGRGTRDQIANICWIIKKARKFQKNIYFCFIDYAKTFDWSTINCGKFFKRREYQTT